MFNFRSSSPISEQEKNNIRTSYTNFMRGLKQEENNEMVNIIKFIRTPYVFVNAKYTY